MLVPHGSWTVFLWVSLVLKVAFRCIGLEVGCFHDFQAGLSSNDDDGDDDDSSKNHPVQCITVILLMVNRDEGGVALDDMPSFKKNNIFLIEYSGF